MAHGAYELHNALQAPVKLDLPVVVGTVVCTVVVGKVVDATGWHGTGRFVGQLSSTGS